MVSGNRFMLRFVISEIIIFYMLATPTNNTWLEQ
jgi:hypothetical protein